MKTSKKDKEIIEIKAKIKTKIEVLNKALTYKPLTTNVFCLGGISYNFHVIDESQFAYIISVLTSMKAVLDAKKLPAVHGGYAIQDWIQDAEAKLMMIAYKKELEQLKGILRRLENHLSDEYKKDQDWSNIQKDLTGLI